MESIGVWDIEKSIHCQVKDIIFNVHEYFFKNKTSYKLLMLKT